MQSNKPHPSNYEIGTIFYECEGGYNIKARCLTKPEKVEPTDENDQDAWKWTAENVYNGEEISYHWNSKYAHYGPRLYETPQYIHIVHIDKMSEARKALINNPDVPYDERMIETAPGNWIFTQFVGEDIDG